jgi:hypothetical protein
MRGNIKNSTSCPAKWFAASLHKTLFAYHSLEDKPHTPRLLIGVACLSIFLFDGGLPTTFLAFCTVMVRTHLIFLFLFPLPEKVRGFARFP